jgi:hypothetical protein
MRTVKKKPADVSAGFNDQNIKLLIFEKRMSQNMS